MALVSGVMMASRVVDPFKLRPLSEICVLMGLGNEGVSSSGVLLMLVSASSLSLLCDASPECVVEISFTERVICERCVR